MKFPPRIRGRVGQAESGQGFDGKWFFTIYIATLYGENIGEQIGPFGPFDSEKIALVELKKAVRIASEAYENIEVGKVSGQYLDMINGGVLRKWEES